jgi:hypothetical protein
MNAAQHLDACAVVGTNRVHHFEARASAEQIEAIVTTSFRGDALASNPESRDSGSDACAPSRNDDVT